MNSYEDPVVLNHDLLEQIEWFLTSNTKRDKELVFMEDGRLDHYGDAVVTDLSMTFWNYINNECLD